MTWGRGGKQKAEGRKQKAVKNRRQKAVTEIGLS